MKKRLLTAVLTLALVVALTACGKEGTTGSSGDVTLGKYKDVEIELLDLSVTDADVESEIYYSLSEFAVDTERTTVANHDVVNIDFVGTLDGVAFEGGSAEGVDLVIGSDSFIDGFEEGLIGAVLGETADLNLTFPESYGSAELAGKDVVFAVTVNSIKELPELTDAFIAENTDYTTYSEYQEAVRESLQASVDATIESQLNNDLMDAIIAGATFNVDLTEEINAYSDNMKAMYEYYASAYGLDLESFVNGYFGMTLDTFNTEIPKAAELAVKRQYVLLEVAAVENMQVTDEEYSEYADQMMTDYQYSTLEELEADYAKEEIIESILYDKALEFVLANVVRK